MDIPPGSVVDLLMLDPVAFHRLPGSLFRKMDVITVLDIDSTAVTQTHENDPTLF